MENWAFFLGISAAIKNVQDDMPNIVVVNVYEMFQIIQEKRMLFLSTIMRISLWKMVQMLKDPMKKWRIQWHVSHLSKKNY